MEERILKRITEVRAAEKQAEQQLIAVRTVLAELEALLEPQPTGDDLGEQGA